VTQSNHSQAKSGFIPAPLEQSPWSKSPISVEIRKCHDGCFVDDVQRVRVRLSLGLEGFESQKHCEKVTLSRLTTPRRMWQVPFCQASITSPRIGSLRGVDGMQRLTPQIQTYSSGESAQATEFLEQWLLISFVRSSRNTNRVRRSYFLE
jgi:hypothetical protein